MEIFVFKIYYAYENRDLYRFITHLDDFCLKLAESATASPTATTSRATTTATEASDIGEDSSQIPLNRQKHTGTGFGEIFWKHLVLTDDEIGLTEGMFTNGRELINANHIRNVTENLTLSEITDICLPQTNIREVPYKLFLKLDKDWKIIRKECKCDWGGGKLNNYKYYFW